MNTKQMAGSVIKVLLKIMIAAVIVFFVYKGAAAAYDYGYRVFAEPAMAPEGSGQIISVAITEGKSVKEVGEILASKGLIRDPQLFYIQYLTSKYNEKDIVPGVYELSTEMVAEDILGVITTVPEGGTEDNSDSMNNTDDSDEADDTGEESDPEEGEDSEDAGE